MLKLIGTHKAKQTYFHIKIIYSTTYQINIKLYPILFRIQTQTSKHQMH